jgi:hypothetical protein
MDEGHAIMIRAFQSREFGFGMQLTEAQLILVNEISKGRKCCDVKVAKNKAGAV